VRAVPRCERHQCDEGVPHLAGQRPALPPSRAACLPIGRSRRQCHECRGQVPQRRRTGQSGCVLREPRSAQPAAATATKAAPAKPDAIEAGKAAVASCTGCHGENGITKTPGMPNLVGLDPKYLVATMKAYKGGQYKSES